jgi:hypothetical protein
MARLSQLNDPDETCAVRLTRLTPGALADVRDLCRREGLPIDMRVKSETEQESVVELIAPYKELLQYFVWIFSREYAHAFEVEAIV